MPNVELLNVPLVMVVRRTTTRSFDGNEIPRSMIAGTILADITSDPGKLEDELWVCRLSTIPHGLVAATLSVEQIRRSRAFLGHRIDQILTTPNWPAHDRWPEIVWEIERHGR